MLRWSAESFSTGYCIEEIMFNSFRFLASKMVPNDWKKKAEELATIGKWDDSHAKLLIKAAEQLQHITDDIDSEIVSLIRNEWDEYKAIVGKLLPAFLSDLFQKDFKSDEFVQMFGLLEKAKENFLGVYDYENAVKNACCASWNANLSNPETMKGENQFNFLVSAFDDGGLGYFDDGLVSATLFMDKKPLLHRDRKAGFIYGMDAQNLVAMSIYDVNTASYYVDSGTRNGDIWPFTELPFYAGPGRVLCSCLGSEDTFDAFSCYTEKYLKHNQIGEIVLTSLAKPQGMLLHSDADLKLKQGVYGYASLFQLPVVEYCHEINKCTTVFPERSCN